MAGFDHAQAIRLSIAEGAPSTNFSTNDADVAIKWRDDAEEGVDAVPFIHSARYPVVSPALLAGESMSHPGGLLRLTLFRDEVDDQWPAWFRAVCIVAELAEAPPPPPNCEYASTAAEAGLGVSLAYEAIVGPAVAEGRLVRLFETTTIPFTIYAIATDAARRDDPLIGAFRDWLLAEVRHHSAISSPIRVAE